MSDRSTVRLNLRYHWKAALLWRIGIGGALVFALCTMIDRAEAWVQGYQPFPEGSAIVLLHRFCRAANCDYSDLTGREWAVAIQNAARAWNVAGSNFSFFERGARTNNDPCRPQDGNVYVILADPGTLCPGDGPLRAAGRTEYGPGWARVYIKANSESSKDPRDLQRLLLHEFGHVVGLGHPDENAQYAQAIMNSHLGTRQGEWVAHYELQPDDIAGIRALYPIIETIPPSDTIIGFLENPGADSSQSGVGIISGWVCEAEEVVIEINGTPQVAAYGTARLDTQETCGDTDNGFGLLFNWNLLGDGEHTVVALVDGMELGRATVTVTTLGEEFLRGATGEYVLRGFPDPNSSVVIEWQESLQNFVIAEFEPPTRSTRCTPKTGQPAYFEKGDVTVTNSCDGRTLIIKGVHPSAIVCGALFLFEQRGVRFQSSHFDLTFNNCAGYDGRVPSTITLTVDESSPLDLLEPFQLFYNSNVIFTFP